MEANRLLLANKYARIIDCIAKEKNIPRLQAMKIFYESDTVGLLDEGVSDLHCEGTQYLADEIFIEMDAEEYMRINASMYERLLAYKKAFQKIVDEK